MSLKQERGNTRGVPRRKRLGPVGRSLVIALALIIALVALFTAVANLVFVPRLLAAGGAGSTAAGAGKTTAGRATGSELEVAKARYLPGYGLVLKDIVVRSSAPGLMGLEVRAGRLRFRPPAAMVRARRSLDSMERIQRGLNSRRESFLAAFTRAAAGLDESGLLPRRLLADDITVSLDASSGLATGSAVRIGVDRLTVTSNRSADRISFSASRGRSAGQADSGSASPPALFTGSAELYHEEGRAHLSGMIEQLPGADRIAGELNLSLASATAMNVSGDLSVAGVSLALPVVDADRIEFEHLSYVFRGKLETAAVLPPPHQRDARTLSGQFPMAAYRGQEGVLELGGVPVRFVPTVEGLLGAPANLGVGLSLEGVPVQDLLAAIPAALSGPLAHTLADGRIDWRLNLQLPLYAAADVAWRSDLLLEEFAVRSIHSLVNVYKLNEAFVHTIRDAERGYVKSVRIPEARRASMEWMLDHSEHSRRRIERIRTQAEEQRRSRPPVSEVGTGDSAPSDAGPPDSEYVYVRLEEMSAWVPRAFLTAEDGDFFFYRGVNPVTLADAIELNIESGEILIGASTISMQLVKMLFLDQERVFSRKLRELFLVHLMEQHVPVEKDRILELYLNLVELGPEIYGIHEAAHHYFGKHPRDLDAGEATFLASILPAPRVYYREFEAGEISDEWFSRMRRLYAIMLERGRMSEGEYEREVRRRPVFVPSEPGGTDD